MSASAVPFAERSILPPAWIAVDWGTTHLRAWAIGENGQVIAAGTSKAGMGSLDPDAFEAALCAVVDDWLSPGKAITVIACGMVGARQGWREADYLPVPTVPLVPDRFVQVPTQDSRLRVFIIPGLKQLDPPDVMRGEETQIAGFLAEEPEYSGVICMPGTHTKWVKVSNQNVAAFHSFMTGEIFGLLEQQSVLRHSLSSEAFHRQAYKGGLEVLREDPSLQNTGLFRLRADDLLNGTDPSVARARLSAYLIGAEVLSASDCWSGQDVVLIGEAHLADLYSEALLTMGCTPIVCQADDLTLSGLSAAHSLWMNEETRCES